MFGVSTRLSTDFDKFSTFLIDFGFRCSESDPSLFVYTAEKRHYHFNVVCR